MRGYNLFNNITPSMALVKTHYPKYADSTRWRLAKIKTRLQRRSLSKLSSRIHMATGGEWTFSEANVRTGSITVSIPDTWMLPVVKMLSHAASRSFTAGQIIAENWSVNGMFARGLQSKDPQVRTYTLKLLSELTNDNGALLFNALFLVLPYFLSHFSSLDQARVMVASTPGLFKLLQHSAGATKHPGEIDRRLISSILYNISQNRTLEPLIFTECPE
jgi:hypothetical protein